MNDLVLLCTIADQRVAIDALAVQSVIEIDEITPIPACPPHIVGLSALRSQALNVIECALALGLERRHGHDSDKGRRAVVVEIEGHLYALLVDDASNVATTLSQPLQLPGGLGAAWQRAASGMVETDGGPALLIDVEQLILGPARTATAAA